MKFSETNILTENNRNFKYKNKEMKDIYYTFIRYSFCVGIHIVFQICLYYKRIYNMKKNILFTVIHTFMQSHILLGLKNYRYIVKYI